jgi:hypothetical protein
MDMPRPTEAHRKLERIVGRWIGEERLHPSPWDAAGGTALGRVDNRLALDGFVVVQEYEQERNGAITFRGHGVVSWDATQQCYVMHWFDSMGMPPNVFRGSFDGGVLLLTGKDQQGQSRVTFDFSRDGEYTFRMEVSPDGSQWLTFMEGAYTRQDG